MNQKWNILIAWVLCTVAFPALCVGQAADSPANGKIQLSAVMPNDELISSLYVIVEGEHYRRELSLNPININAKIDFLEVPPGIYRVSSHNGYYYDFQRAQFRVHAHTVTKINVFPLLRILTQMLMADGSDRYEFAPKPKYDSFAVPQSPNGALKMLIRYGKKHRANDSIAYSGSGVMVSYDAFTLYADEVRFDPTKFILYANGNVVIEDGAQRARSNTVVVKFKNGTPEIVRN